jgi:hypothetical protein
MVLTFTLAVKSAKGPTPSPSLHPSRPSFDDVREALKHGLVEAPKDQSTAKKHVSHHVSSTWSIFSLYKISFQALIRDDHRCVVTGGTDFYSKEKIPRLEERCLRERVSPVFTQVAHIFPASTNKRVAVDEKSHRKV